MPRPQDHGASVPDFHNQLQKIHLNLHKDKIQSGRLGQNAVEFCGWKFVGGYTTISSRKIELFKTKISQVLKTKNSSLSALIKKLNYKILGFGHYYKYGQVKRIYEQLDTSVRLQFYNTCIRGKFFVHKGAYKLWMKQQGLKSLADILLKVTPVKTPKKYRKLPTTPPTEAIPPHHDYTDLYLKLIEQQKQIIGILRDIKHHIQNPLISPF